MPNLWGNPFIFFSLNGCGESDELERRAFGAKFACGTISANDAEKGKGKVLRKTGKESISHESSYSLLLSLRIWPKVTNPDAEARAANRCSLPCPEEDGWASERSGSGHDTQTPERQKQHVYINPGSWVIVAEDDVVLRSLFSEALREKGLQVLSAANGLEALELYRENADKIWLVVTDVIMPGMDGLTAAVEMRKIDKNVFFLFMSGHDLQVIEKTGFTMEDIPNSDFYQKPFAFRDMISRIQMLGAPQQWE
jgi:CheY-like chemotaxis protein